MLPKIDQTISACYIDIKRAFECIEFQEAYRLFYITNKDKPNPWN